MWNFRIIVPVLLLSIGHTNGVFWNDLRLTFNLRFPTTGFTTFPRTEQDAKEAGFQRDSANCLNNGEFYGVRYVDPEDDYVSVLFDVQGTIAGVQLMLPETLLREKGNYRYQDVPYFQLTSRRGQRFYMLNAYFVRVENICTVGRPKCALLNEGTGTGLYFQNGNTKNMITCPRDRATAIRNGWSDRYCVPGMGKHNYYLADRWGDNNCRNVMMQPFFGLYNQQDQLHGFGFTIERAVPNKRFEIQTKGNIQGAQGPTVPTCVLDKVDVTGITTLHVYFTNDPWRITCPGYPTLMQLIQDVDRKEIEERIKYAKCPKPEPVIYTSPPRLGSSGPSTNPNEDFKPKTIKLRVGSRSGSNNNSTTTNTNSDFRIPEGVFRNIMSMNQLAEDESKKSMANQLRPGETYADIDINSAMMNHVMDEHIGNVPLPQYTVEDALLMNAENNQNVSATTAFYKMPPRTQTQTPTQTVETRYVYAAPNQSNEDALRMAIENDKIQNPNTMVVYGDSPPVTGNNVETHVIYVSPDGVSNSV